MRGYKTSVLSVLAAAAALTCSAGAIAAQVDKDDLARMSADARKKGLTPVVVHLAPVSLSEMSADIAGVKARMTGRANLLVAELGQEASEAGRWENGIGQLGLNVTDAGLKLLQNSGNAVSFYPGKAWHERTALFGHDGRFVEIERQLSAQGYVDVQVSLNVEALEFDLAQDGSLAFRSNDKGVASAVQRAKSLFGQLSNSQAVGKDVAESRFAALAGQSAGTLNPEFTVRVNREGLEKLAASNDVRSLRPVGFVDKRPLRFDADVIASAEKNGTADVIVTVRTPMAGGQLSRASLEAASRSHKRTIEAVLAGAGANADVKDLSVFGAVSLHLSASELKALRSHADPRLLSVELNKPIAGVQLMTSTVSSNFTSAWAAGYRGAGQNIVVMDTGVQSNHKFFQGASGATKVVYEACFGSNASAYNLSGVLVNYESNCPSQVGTTGDSPLGLVGSAAPRLNCAGNSSPNFAACHHGTHVSGIAAGRNSPTFVSGFQGVANEANIVAVQVFSFDKLRVDAPSAFTADLVAAMQAVVSAMTPGTAANPYTVNMSLGSDAVYSGACSTVSSAFTTAVQTLYNYGVPVVAANGNKGSKSGVSFPACVPRVVKVGSVQNDAAASTISTFSNLGNPANFPGDFFWMAPGGGGTTNVTSAINGTITVNGWTQSTGGISGTSQATPHVAGLYALVKAGVPGIAVADVSNWIQANASVPLAAVTLDGGVGPGLPPPPSVVFRRIRVPNF